MPKKQLMRTLIYEQIVGEMLFDPLEKEESVGRHADDNDNGVPDHIESVDPVWLRDQQDQSWCEDRENPGDWSDPYIYDEPYNDVDRSDDALPE